MGNNKFWYNDVLLFITFFLQRKMFHRFIETLLGRHLGNNISHSFYSSGTEARAKQNLKDWELSAQTARQTAYTRMHSSLTPLCPSTASRRASLYLFFIQTNEKYWVFLPVFKARVSWHMNFQSHSMRYWVHSLASKSGNNTCSTRINYDACQEVQVPP